MSIVTIVAEFSDRIQNGRTIEKIFDSLESEVDELRVEVYAQEADKGPDGKFGEAIDIIACALDIIRKERPNSTMAELEEECARYITAKCEKWEHKVRTGQYS